MRFYDSISGYRFILIASNSIDQKKIDSKLEEIYKVYVNYVLKAPFLNVNTIIFRNNKRLRVLPFEKKVMRFYIGEYVYEYSIICFHFIVNSS